MVTYWARHAPAEVMEWTSTLGDEELRVAVTDELVMGWGQMDSYAASEQQFRKKARARAPKVA